MNADLPPYGDGVSSAQQASPAPSLQHGSASRWGPTSMGIDPAVAAGLAYLFGGHLAGILPIIWLFAEKRNRFIRFHAVQALLGFAAYFVGALIAAGIFVVGLLVAEASGADNQTAGAIASAAAIGVFVVLTVAVLACDVWGMIAGFRGKFVKLPLVGNLAARLVGGPPAPLY